MALSFLARSYQLKLLRSWASVMASSWSAPTQPGRQHLYTPAALGIDQFIITREKTAVQFRDIRERFTQQMCKMMEGNDKAMVFTEDLKNILQLTEGKEEELQLVLEMLKRFNKQHQGLRFGTFVFGPVVMRMYHHLNLPDQALLAFKTPELAGFFDQMVSYQILMDLLHKNGKYEETLQVFDVLMSTRITGVKYPKNCLIVALAACYKMDSPESLKKMEEILHGTREYGVKYSLRMILLVSALALRQHHAHVAMEILSEATSIRHIAVRSMKVMALCELGRMEDVITILGSILQQDLPSSPHPRQHCILQEAIDVAEAAVQKLEKKDVSTDFARIVKNLQENESISQKSLDELVCEPIDAFQSKDRGQTRERQKLAASFYGRDERRQHSRQSRHYRPGLADME